MHVSHQKKVGHFVKKRTFHSCPRRRKKKIINKKKSCSLRVNGLMNYRKICESYQRELSSFSLSTLRTNDIPFLSSYPIYIHHPHIPRCPKTSFLSITESWIRAKIMTKSILLETWETLNPLILIDDETEIRRLRKRTKEWRMRGFLKRIRNNPLRENFRDR